MVNAPSDYSYNLCFLSSTVNITLPRTYLAELRMQWIIMMQTQRDHVFRSYKVVKKSSTYMEVVNVEGNEASLPQSFHNILSFPSIDLSTSPFPLCCTISSLVPFPSWFTIFSFWRLPCYFNLSFLFLQYYLLNPPSPQPPTHFFSLYNSLFPSPLIPCLFSCSILPLLFFHSLFPLCVIPPPLVFSFSLLSRFTVQTILVSWYFPPSSPPFCPLLLFLPLFLVISLPLWHFSPFLLLFHFIPWIKLIHLLSFPPF